MAKAIRGNSLYTIVNGPSWTQAEANAVGIGGHLATLNSQEEDAFVWGTLRSYSWIGLTDRATEGQWRWITGERLTYSNWAPGEPNNGLGGGNQNYAWYWDVYPGNWDDHWENPANVSSGIAEIPLTLSITRSTTPKEGTGSFTTSINLSAGSQSSGNLAEGAQVWWKVTGITQDDLALGALAGSGTITNGILDIQHSLVSDNDKGEQFSVSVYSDSGLTQQIGATSSEPVQEGTQTAGPITTISDAIKDITLSDYKINLSHFESYSVHGSIVVDARITGLTRIEAQWSASNGNARVFAQFTPTASDANGNLILEGDLRFGGFYAEGIWSLSAMSLLNDNAHLSILSSGSNGLPSQTINSNVTVTNTKGDGYIPSLTSVGFTQDMVNLDPTNGASVPLVWSYQDQGSGVVNREAQIYDPLGHYYKTVDGLLSLPPDAIEGAYTINNARLDDKAANIYYTPDLSPP